MESRLLTYLFHIITDSFNLDLDDFRSALSEFKPSGRRGLELHKPGNLGWEDVGGLKQVKKILIETLQWPAMVSTNIGCVLPKPVKLL